ncbi:MAG: hypothetical protein Q8K35_04035 [Thiobacillus sp.]|nr:hypothetical protein [Thiobacillus sp.]MDP2056914.1 hypothetical protein [Thiobacillus sp.]
MVRRFGALAGTHRAERRNRAYRRAYPHPLHDLLAKHLGQQKTTAILIDLTTLLRVEPVDHQVLQQALALGWRDCEDAVQAVTAAQCQADFLVTRNPRDFRQSLVTVITPSEFLALLA